MGFYPTGSPLTAKDDRKGCLYGGNIFCCSCRQTVNALLVREREWVCPDLLFRQAILYRRIDDTESREVPLTIAFLAIVSDGTPACQKNEPPGNRTLNLQLKRLLLCRLS